MELLSDCDFRLGFGSICTYGYLRVSSLSLETDILTFTLKCFPPTVLVLHLNNDDFALVLTMTSSLKLFFLVLVLLLFLLI